MADCVNGNAPRYPRQGNPSEVGDMPASDMMTAVSHVTGEPAHGPLPEAAVAFFHRHGYLHLPGFFSSKTSAAMRTWADAMQAWPETPGKWMMYFETTDRSARQLCRLECFLDYHQGFSDVLNDHTLLQGLSQLMAEQAVLFKEKINFKLPGGRGFAAHQDAPAFAAFGQHYHITAMIGLDAATRANGCLEVVPGLGLRDLLPQAGDGTIDHDTATRLDWHPVETAPGDLLLFDSYLPHRSNDNHTDAPRRALFVTYNRRREGLRRDAYYADKRDKFPPECERVPGRDYRAGAQMYNLANPIRG